MVAAGPRGGDKPSLNEALGWIGSRVDDVFGNNVGRLDDVWIDPGTGQPRWLLVSEGRFGGRSTLIPFDDATAGAGHVWIPYEREVVRAAPEVDTDGPLTQQLEAELRHHFEANSPAPGAVPPGPGAPAGAPSTEQEPTGAEAGSQPSWAAAEPPRFGGSAPARPEPLAQEGGRPIGAGGSAAAQTPAAERPATEPSAGAAAVPVSPGPASEAAEDSGGASSEDAESRPAGGYRLEIELGGGLRISGELKSLRLIPPDDL